MPGGHSVVAGVPPRLEWSGLLPRRPPSGDTVLRRIGSLGLRGFRARVGRVASAPVAQLLVGDSNSGEGAGTDRGRLGCVGEQLVRGHCAGVLRQHGRSTESQQRLREGPTTQSSAPNTRVALREVGLRADHIAGLQNRDNAPLFFSLFPQALRSPTVVPEQIKALLLDLEGAWTSKNWMGKLGHCLSGVCWPALGARTAPGREGTSPSVPGPT